MLRASVEALTKVRGWAAGLASAKQKLEGQVRNWQAEAERCEEVVLKLKNVLDLERGAVERLGRQVAELEEDRLKLETALRTLERQTWTRVGRRLRLLAHPSFFPQGEAPDIGSGVGGSGPKTTRWVGSRPLV